MAKILIFDDAAGGHHPDFIAGIVSAALARDCDLLTSTTEFPAELLDHEAVRRIPVETFGLREVRKGRQAWQELQALCEREQIDHLWDLFLDKNVWAVTPNRAKSSHVPVHVLHRVAQYRYHGRSGVAKARTFYLRRHLRNLAVGGHRVVVHTEAAASVLRRFMPADKVAVLGLPVCLEAELGRRVSPYPANETPILLFVGAARPEKGLHCLLEAVSRLKQRVIIAIAGAQPPGTRESVTAAFPQLSIKWSDRYLSRQELDFEFASSSLVVLPYQSTYGTGPASGVLWETLSYGRPLVVSEALADQLPPTFDGAMATSTSAPELLTAGLDTALSSLPGLATAAIEQGPGIIAESHTFESYVERMLAWIP